MDNEAQIESVAEPNVGLGYFLSFLIPLAGFFYGVYLMARKKPGHGAACMAVSIAITLGWLTLFLTGFKPFDKQESIGENLVAAAAKEKPDVNLRPVQGAYLWNLGEKVSDSFEVKTNDDFYLTHDFGDNGQSDYGYGYHILTKERRIAAIVIQSTQGRGDEIRKILTDKYGFRKIRHYSSGKDYDCYFGPTNRQAVLHISDNAVIQLEYRDEELCQFAEAEKESRKKAAETGKNGQADDFLKKRL